MVQRMKVNDRIRNYANQQGIDPTGALRSNETKAALAARLTPKQRKRLRKKNRIGV